MPEPDLIELFVRPLEHQGVRYLVSGSVAAMLYGEPRITHDVDLIVFLRGMLRLSGDQVDAAALDEWVKARQVQAEWLRCSQGP